ncbi:MAG: helix-turn-helix domain-containing protein [Verrucomicrobiota bacterium]
MEELADQIGELLRKAREQADLVVEDVVFQTRIPKSVVVALETGDFSVFSSPTYARSFLSQYSDFLQVDARTWLDALEPLSYASGDVELSGGGEQTRRSVVQAAPGPSGGWLAAVGMLAISCAFVFAAMRGYHFLEQKLGSEDKPSVAVEKDSALDAEVAAQPPAQVRTPVPEEQRQTASLPAPGIAEPPPRATVVREP